MLLFIRLSYHCCRHGILYSGFIAIIVIVVAMTVLTFSGCSRSCRAGSRRHGRFCPLVGIVAAVALMTVISQSV